MRIIAALDFSPSALNAAHSAAELARVFGDTLVLVQAVPVVAAQYPNVALNGSLDLDEPLRQAAREALEGERRELNKLYPDLPIEVRMEIGFAETTLCRLATELPARLIVMGAHSRGVVSQLLAGSVCQRTLREAPCPVLVLRKDAAPFKDWAHRVRPLRVLVGVDRGPGTEAALAFLSSLREMAPCDVVMVHDYWPPGEYARLGLRGPRELGRDDAEVVAILDRDLSAALPPLTGNGKVELRVRSAWGPVGAQLALDAEAERADLLLLGTHQPHGFNRLATGSDALSALHGSTVPLLVVPARRVAPATVSAAPIPILRSVLVATDFSDLGNAAIPAAYALVRRPGGRVELCHVQERHLPSPSYLYGDSAGPDAAEAARASEQKLAALIPAQAAELGMSSHVTVIEGGAAAEQILAAAARLGVDAIVISSHGRGGLGRAVLGSVAEAVVRGSERPVHVVRPARPGL